nr:endolytic transglycosylase MltG [Solirubrobacterales bacterium]
PEQAAAAGSGAAAEKASTDPTPPTSSDPPAASAPDAAAAAAAGVAAVAAASSEPRTPPPDPVTPEPPVEQSWEAEPPEEDWGFHDEGDPEMAGAARHGGRGGGKKGGGGFLGALRRHPFRIAAGILVLIVLWFLYALFQPFHGDGTGKVKVTIPKGSSVSEVGDLLGKKGVVDSSTMFQIRVTLAGKRSDLYAGHFTLAHGMSYGAAIEALSSKKGQGKSNIVTVTIPEGYTRSQTAKLVKEDGLVGNYEKETVKSKYLNPAKYGGKKAKDLEGFLFPDTWELKRKSPVANLVQLQLQDFKKRIKGVDMSYAKSKNLTVYDVLTIASIIEHEAGVPSQRKLVAAVFYNRLHEHISLGSDATVRFATGNFTEPLKQSELESESPYNTRNHTGLPPGPIDSPGLAAIEAAARPAKVDDLFFVTSPDCKKLAFSKTEAEFERDVARYEASSCGE